MLTTILVFVNSDELINNFKKLIVFKLTEDIYLNMG